ncbi:WhiB family transcriptional regulator [Rhodococcus opacus]|uniref:WhiB family transcriptional regulator n=1 Tax=Rhodococcus opacus TaxID=37919 RepID=UPI000EA8991B|nr:WhiB family transcriptional regulator [Rhodococcus opacus]QZS57567.1 WhiB family transcriptional regulator [Rhodococcus opacus]RKM75819.1 WhiB family transcriptional regulator [Rhodococcus opacus]
MTDVLDTTLPTLLPASDDPTGWVDAACRADPEPDRWFPFPTEDFAYARDVCHHCPLRMRCELFARATGQTGVWGGKEFDRGREKRT